MLYAKLVKPSSIQIYTKEEDGKELESYSLLKISILELLQILKHASEKDISFNENSLTISFKNNKEVHTNFKAIANEHKTKHPNTFLDVSKKFNSTIVGTSVLVRDPEKHLIWIAKRKGNDLQNINRICITDKTREKFFQDVKVCKYFLENKKYIMDTRDNDIYSYWSKYMNNSYIEQLKEHLSAN